MIVAGINYRSNITALALALLLSITLFAIVVSAHALERHGAEAVIAHKCIDSPDFIFYNPIKERFAYVCMTEFGKWGIAILDKFEREITAFIKNKITNTKQLFRYMKNSGYELVH